MFRVSGASQLSVVQKIAELYFPLRVAEQLKKNSPERYPLQLLVWILGQLAGIGTFGILNHLD